MPITELPPTHRAELADTTVLTWRCPQPELWVAVDEAGRPAGIVSQRRRGLYVTTAVTGHALGQYDTLCEAQGVLERHAAAGRGRVGLITA